MTGLEVFTIVHVAISLIGIAAGFVVLYGLLSARALDGWTAVFLAFTAATSLTGFFFPFHGFTPAFGFGVVSIVVLAVAAFARYGRRLAGPWRVAWVITAMIAFYLNFFVLVVQSFDKIPALNALAPTQKEPPFAVTQLVVLVLFVAAAIAAARKFRVRNSHQPSPERRTT